MKNSRLALKHPKVGSLERRLFLKQSLSIGALSLLAGCEITGDENVQQRERADVTVERLDSVGGQYHRGIGYVGER